MMDVGSVVLSNPIFLQTITVFYQTWVDDGNGNFATQYNASFMQASVQPHQSILTYKPDGNHTMSDIVIYSKNPIIVSDSYDSVSTIIEYQGFLYNAMRQRDWNKNGYYKTIAVKKYQKKLEISCIYQIGSGAIYQTSDGFLFRMDCEIPTEKQAVYATYDNAVYQLKDESLLQVST